MIWCDFISDVYAKRKLDHGMESKPVFQAPASIQNCADLESQLGTALPAELRSLLLETNGVISLLKIDDGEWFEDMWLFWPTSQIIHATCFIVAKARQARIKVRLRTS
ncbi:MAG: SMI1/KNR4 family protein [Planctomycetes bacterium]|nr:SMI1/KNR4 family protein [Planctomycetota bacterium]